MVWFNAGETDVPVFAGVIALYIYNAIKKLKTIK